MANGSRHYYSLPTEAPQRSRSGSRRPPLTPSTVSSPCLTTHVPVASRRDSGSSSSPTKASALLAKVVSSPTLPRVETSAGSPMPSPETRICSGPTYSPERPTVWRSESDRYVRQYKQQGKHDLLMPGYRSTRLTLLQMVTSASLILRSSAKAKRHMISTASRLLSRRDAMKTWY